MSLVLVILITIAWFRAQALVSAQLDKFTNCSTLFQCGNITEIGYPFWGSARPSYCGHPDFHLNCSGQTASMSMSGLTYQVLNIDNTLRVLTLARTDYQTSICSQYLFNNSIDPNLFTYNQDTFNLTIYYNCSSAVPRNNATAISSAVLSNNTTTFSSVVLASKVPNISPNTTVITSSAPYISSNRTGNTYSGTYSSPKATRITSNATGNTYSVPYISANATGIISNVTGISTQINCITNGTESSGYYTVGNLTNSLGSAMAETIYKSLDSCSHRVVAPADKSAVAGSLSNASYPTEDDLVGVLDKGFGLVWDADNTESSCSACKESGGACGYGNDRFYCYCSSGEFPRRCNDGSTSLDPPQSSSRSGIKSNTRMKIIIGLSAGATGAILILVGYICLLKNTRNGSVHYHPDARKSDDRNKEFKMFIMNHRSQMPQQYSYSNIKKMTKKFAHKLGQGGFGGVYKGELPDGRLVAVKVLHTSDNEGEGFINEVASISRTSHVNIVNLLGYCYDKKKALVYQYMPKGSLDKYTYQQESQTMECALEWNVLYNVAAGTARGLEYLHRGCNTRIVHLDIKPHNVLLDDDFCPKISDFGLAKLCKGKESKLSLLGARGTPGYIAPEVFSRNFGMVSYKSDVYSYGMLVLEMVGARKNHDTGSSDTSTKYFPDWIYEQLEQDEISCPHREITKTEEEIARKLILVGLWCIQKNPIDRPNMTRVIEMLEDNSQTLSMPPKPNLYLPARSPSQRNSSAASLVTYTRSGTNEEDGNTRS